MSDVYESDLRAAARILSKVKEAEANDVFIASGSVLMLVNANGYPVGRWELEADENWKFVPHDDNERAS